MLGLPQYRGASMTADIPPPVRARRRQILLIVIAAAETLSTLSDLPGIVAPYLDDAPTGFLLFAQILLSLKFALAPCLAVPALYFAVKGRLREATMALGGLLLLAWLLDDTTSIVIHGTELSASFGGAIVAMHHFLYPLLGLAGGGFAYIRRQPALAAVLVSLPTVLNWTGFVIFAVGIFIHGF